MSVRLLYRLLLCAGLLFAAGCTALEPLLAALTPAPVPTRRPTTTPPAIITPTAIIPTQPAAPLLRIWLPPQFDPASDNEASRLLAERLAEFEAQHTGLTLEVRVKNAEVEEDLVNMLSVTSAAAPSALPDLVLLSRPQVELAAQSGLLHPFDGLSTALEDPNWFGYAQQLAHVQNTGYGLPLAGNALALVYYPELGTLVSWEDVLASEGQLVFPAGSEQGLVALSLYASAGGDVLDNQGQPILETEPLTRMLTFLEDGVAKEVFPRSLTNVTTEAQTLQIYRSGSANKSIVWVLDYRPNEDGSVIPLPGLEDAAFSYATGWVWALAGSNPEHQQLAVELAEFLVEDPFVGQWARASGYLPTRPSSVGESNRMLSAILESAHLVPSHEVLAILGPLMQQATTRVLNGEEPEAVAQSIVDALK